MSRSCSRLLLKIDSMTPSILVLVAQLARIIVELLSHVFIRTLFIKPACLILHLISIVSSRDLIQDIVSRITSHFVRYRVINQLLIGELFHHLTVDIIAVGSMMIDFHIFVTAIVS